MNTLIKTSVSRTFLRLALLVSFAMACFALSPGAEAVLPAPTGGYPDENTAAGDNALLGLTNGFLNTALGFDALRSDTQGSFNTATGAETLTSNAGGTFNTATGAQALRSNTTGNNNTGDGTGALFSLT